VTTEEVMMIWVGVVALLALIVGTFLWLSHRAKRAEDETAYLPDGGFRPGLNNKAWSLARHGYEDRKAGPVDRSE
jgi:hypothetical protein